jgi:hypothetical protein
MIIPSFLPGMISPILQIQTAAGGGGSDVTPAAVNWGDISVAGTRYTTQQITSISSSITVQLTASGTPGTRLWYKIDTTGPIYTTGTPTSYGFTQITSFPINITVNNNEYLSFGMASAVNRGSSSTITVTNTSDSNTVLDTFLISF